MTSRFLRPLLALVLVAPALRAAPAGDVITDEQIEPEVKDLQRKLADVRGGGTPLEQLIEVYQLAARRAQDPRDRAKREFLLGQLYLIANRPRDGQLHFERARDAYPRFPAVYQALGQIAAGTDKEAAARLARKALVIDAQYQPAILMLGQLAAMDRDFEKAYRYFAKSLEIEVTELGCLGMAKVCLALYVSEFDPDKKEAYARKARQAARGLMRLLPNEPVAHDLRARVYLATGETDEAIAALEKSCAANLDVRVHAEFLQQLLELYAQRGDAVNGEKTVQRLLATGLVTGPGRALLERTAADLEKYGADAFEMTMVRRQLGELANEGSPHRIEALRKVIQWFVSDRGLVHEGFQELYLEVRRTVFRSLVNADANLARATLQIFRHEFQSPYLVGILGHFIYPYAGADRPEELRAEAVKTLAKVGGTAALPALLYALNDDSGRVVRLIDRNLSILCQQRTAVPDEITALTPEQVRQTRGYWLRFRRTDEGGAMLEDGVRRLRLYTLRADEGDTRVQPAVDHVVAIVLLDDDMAWGAWAEGYRFFVDFHGKDFRPPDRRERPLDPAERAELVTRLREYWRTQGRTGGAATPATTAPGDSSKR